MIIAVFSNIINLILNNNLMFLKNGLTWIIASESEIEIVKKNLSWFSRHFSRFILTTKILIDYH